MFDIISSSSNLSTGPMCIPLIAMQLQARWFTDTINELHSNIYDVETSTGMRRFDNSNKNSPEKQDWRQLNLIDFTRSLNSILTRLAFLRLQAETSCYLIEQMQISTKAIETTNSTVAREESYLYHKANYIQGLFRGIKARCNYLTERVQAQVQTVCVSTITNPPCLTIYGRCTV
jgi:hypothetical protein